jgi:hypothetical protein
MQRARRMQCALQLRRCEHGVQDFLRNFLHPVPALQFDRVQDFRPGFLTGFLKTLSGSAISDFLAEFLAFPCRISGSLRSSKHLTCLNFDYFFQLYYLLSYNPKLILFC